MERVRLGTLPPARFCGDDTHPQARLHILSCSHGGLPGPEDPLGVFTCLQLLLSPSVPNQLPTRWPLEEPGPAGGLQLPTPVPSAYRVEGAAAWPGAAQTSIPAAAGPPPASRPRTRGTVCPPRAVASPPALRETCLADAGHLAVSEPWPLCGSRGWVSWLGICLTFPGPGVGGFQAPAAHRRSAGRSGVVQDACGGCPSEVGRFGWGKKAHQGLWPLTNLLGPTRVLATQRAQSAGQRACWGGSRSWRPRRMSQGWGGSGFPCCPPPAPPPGPGCRSLGDQLAWKFSRKLQPSRERPTPTKWQRETAQLASRVEERKERRCSPGRLPGSGGMRFA